MQVEPGGAGFTYDLAGEFAAAMAAVPGVIPGAASRFAVGVSGGPDSLALALLLARWARAHGAAVHALTVDHGLRAAAADEARQVERWMAPIGIAHTTLRWEEGARYRERPGSAQAAAREGRYALMTDWCRASGYSHLFLAHHADDQAETFLLRLARGSGVDGLGAMAPLSARAGVRLVRPLLAIAKARLVAYLNEIGQPWLEDPSNGDDAYARARLRAARGVLEREGLSTERLIATAEHMRRARAALDQSAQALLDAACVWDRFGVARLELGQFLAAPDEVALRGLARVLMTAGGQFYRPRFDRLSRLYDALRVGPWRDSTLHGCVVVREGSALTVAREAAQIADERGLAPGAKVLWDGRYEVEVEGMTLQLRCFSPREAPADLKDQAEWAMAPGYVRVTLPALYDSRGLAAVPSLNYVRRDLLAREGVVAKAAFVCPRIDQFAEDDAEL